LFSEAFMLHKPKHLYSFGSFTLNVFDRILLHGGQEVKLGPTAFDLLLFFVAHAGALVSRDALKQAVWRTGNLEDNNVDQKIAEVRRALARSDRSAGEYIQNVRGHGWRFVAQVTEHREDRPNEETLPAAVSVPVPAPPRVPIVRTFSRRWLGPASFAGATLALGVMVVALGRGRLEPGPGPAFCTISSSPETGGRN
jgi:DNA-binding winged helix-turn-helix (wHTH) protein